MPFGQKKEPAKKAGVLRFFSLDLHQVSTCVQTDPAQSLSSAGSVLSAPGTSNQTDKMPISTVCVQAVIADIKDVLQRLCGDRVEVCRFKCKRLD